MLVYKERVNIDNKVKFYRKKATLTQKELAGKVRISERNLQSIEYGKQVPNVYTAILFAEALQVSVKDLFPLPK